MKKVKPQPLTKISLYFFIFLFLDALTKLFTLRYFRDEINVIPGFFKLVFRKNTGIAFSIELGKYLIIVLTLVMIVLLYFLVKKELNFKKPLAQISVAMIFSGAIGNLSDRLVHGYVIDFLAFWKYPVFNLADVFIVCGILMTIIFYPKIKQK